MTTTWQELFGMKGYYQSEEIFLDVVGDGAINSISWNAQVPVGTFLYVYTSFSQNGGYDWSEWRQATNGGVIPELTFHTPLYGVLLRYRVHLGTIDAQKVPVFGEIQFEFEPVIVFDNKGDTTCTPEIWITKNGNGDFSLTNISNDNETFKFTSLINNETVYVNSEREYIETDLPMVYRYENFNDNYLKLPYGKNVFRVKGNAKIIFRYQFKLI